MDRSDIEKKLSELGVINFKIDDSGLVDIFGNVEIHGTSLEEFPFQFGTVYGNFLVSGNMLHSLKNSPLRITGNADFSFNFLTTLEHCTPLIGGYLNVSRNALETLKGCPGKINGTFSCELNYSLSSLRHAPSCVIMANNTSIDREEQEIFEECVKRAIWMPSKTIRMNLSKLLKTDSSLLSRRWKMTSSLKSQIVFNTLINF